MNQMRSLLLGMGIVALTASGGFAQSPAPLSLYNFYIRGDVGGDIGESTTFLDTNPTASNCSLCTAMFPASIGSSVYFGGGMGYVINPIFRADLTLDYLPSLKASGNSVGGGAGGTPVGTGPVTASAGLDSLVGLLNGYLELDGIMRSWFGPDRPYVGPLRPYLMAGVGFASNDLGTFHGTILSGPLAGSTRTTSGSTQTNFAWGAGAGVAYSLTQQLSLDLAYKFLDLGPLQTGTNVTALGFSGQLTPARSGDLDEHTITIGLRYTFAAP